MSSPALRFTSAALRLFPVERLAAAIRFVPAGPRLPTPAMPSWPPCPFVVAAREGGRQPRAGQLRRLRRRGTNSRSLGDPSGRSI